MGKAGAIQRGCLEQLATPGTPSLEMVDQQAILWVMLPTAGKRLVYDGAAI